MKIAIVGVCASGKTTLVAGLREAGYDAYNVAQEHSCVHESSHHDEEHGDDHHRCGAETRESLLGVEHSGDEQHRHGRKEDQVGPDLGEQQHGEHGEHREYGDPCIKVES